MANQEELQLVETITSLYNSITNLPSLSPSEEKSRLFTRLVNTCLLPSSISIASLPDEARAMRSRLIKLVGEAEGLLESHYSTLISSQDRPLKSLAMYPGYHKYEKRMRFEFDLLSRHVTNAHSLVAFVGSGPLPLSSLILATRYLTGAVFHNYDLDPDANAKARKLVASDPGLAERVVFYTEDITGVKRALSRYDVVFLAALVGMEQEEKRRVLEHLTRHMSPGALLVARSAHGARAFLYPVVDSDDLLGFDVLSVYHPEDDVINSVIVARRKRMDIPCRCCEPHVSHGSSVEDLTIHGQ